MRSRLSAVSKSMWIGGLLILTLPFSVSSCTEDENGWISPFSNCHVEPTHGRLRVEVSAQRNAGVPIQLFEGDFDEGEPFLLDTLYSSSREYRLPVGDYSGTARYLEGVDTILVVAGDDISTSQTEDDDGDLCWQVENGTLDLTL